MALSRLGHNKNALRSNTAVNADVALPVETRVHLLGPKEKSFPLVAVLGLGNAIAIDWVTIAGFPIAVAADRRILQMNPKQ